jgi:hypothetical protein
VATNVDWPVVPSVGGFIVVRFGGGGTDWANACEIGATKTIPRKIRMPPNFISLFNIIIILKFIL